MPTANVIRIEEYGGPEVMSFVASELASLKPGEVRIRQTAVGLNFIDVYDRTGLYPSKLPTILGREAAGVIEEVGEGVEFLREGDRVVYNGLPGAYATTRNVRADKLVVIPDDISDEVAAAVFLKGLTAWMLLLEIRPLEAGERALVWAAAGGVASILIPWATRIGAEIAGVVSTPDKAEQARRLGCSETILSNEDVAARVRAWTDGKGVPVVYDSVGKTSAEASLSSLAPRGWFITFGNASGPVEPIPPLRLNQGGSLVMTRPGLFHFTAARADLERGANALWTFLRESKLQVEIGQRFALADAAEAHRALESRQTIGATILVP